MYVFLDGGFVSQRNSCSSAIFFLFSDYFFSSDFCCQLLKTKILFWDFLPSMESQNFVQGGKKNPLWPVLLRICLAAGLLCFYPLLLHHPCCVVLLLFSFLFVNWCPSPKQQASCTLSEGFTTVISLFWQAEMISKWIVNVRPAVSDEAEEAVTPLSRARFPAGSSCWHRIAMCPFERLSQGPWDFPAACWDCM